ncbi:MAG: hypothetical protein IKK08_01430 [Clostridia bacterium]|nr:hypothetical protein [Clostridia bacterium]
MEKIRRLFGGLIISWKRLIVFAVIAGVYTGIMAMLPMVQGTSFHDIAMSFEWWVLFGIIIITNSASSKDAALKCFVFFLISQPLVYLVQAPFHPEGLRLFRFYPGWFLWTLLTLPMGYIGWMMKRERWWALLILAPVLLFVGFHYESFLSSTISFFPKKLLSTVFCAATMILYPLCIFKDKLLKRLGLCIALVILLVMTAVAVGNQKSFYDAILFTDGSYGVTLEESSRVSLADADMGSVSVTYDEKLGCYLVNGSFTRDGETQLILEAADGTKTVFRLVVENSSYTLVKQ